ncbi:MAG: heterocyst frequency control protein PatD [Coleofasciculaceae cyanobacterium]
MLPASHCEPYQELQKALESMLSKVSSTNWQGAKLQEIDQSVQQVFSQEIANLRADELAPEDISRWQSIQTEIHKQMRLLSTDLMMLQAARSSETFLVRSKSLCDRITTLIQYCQALIDRSRE